MGLLNKLETGFATRDYFQMRGYADSFLIAEAALYGAALLISSDSHIKNINQQMLGLSLNRAMLIAL